MNSKFQSLTEHLDANFRSLMEMSPVVAEEVSRNTPIGGVYLFSENDVPLYAGRTKRKISVRIRSHFNTAPDCPFAWLLARQATGRFRTYQKEGSRTNLLSQPDFYSAYLEAKRRIRRMHVRYVGEADPLRQTLLEIYTAVAADAKYNDFDTH
jgi:hypothetical protein